MPDYLRVRENGTGHEYSVVASAVEPDNHKVLDDEPAVDGNGNPLPPVESTKGGKKAASDKETS